MIMIIYHHLLVHALGLHLLADSKLAITNNTYTDGFLNSFLVMTVNCFVFISGYYGIKFRVKTLINLVLQTTTYSVGIYLLYDYFFESLNFDSLLKGLFPIFRSVWWFISAYIFLYLLSPLLNAAKLNLTKFQFIFVIIIITIMNCIIGFSQNLSILSLSNGYSVFSFICLYLYGYLFKQYFTINRTSSLYIVLYLCISIIIFLMFALCLKFIGPKVAWKIWAYNNPIVILSSISFFYIFKSASISSSRIMKMSPFVLGVYLIHDHKMTRKLIIDNLNMVLKNYSHWNAYFILLFFTIFIFLLCSAIEIIRAKLSLPIVNWLILKIVPKGIDDKINGSL